MELKKLVPIAVAAVLVLAGATASNAKNQRTSSTKHTWKAPGVHIKWGQWGSLSGPRLGAQVQPLTDELRAFFGAKAGEGVLVAKVTKGSAAARAGLRVGDVVVSIDGKSVGDLGDIWDALASKKGGAKVAVGILRNKRRKTLSAVLQGRAGTPLSNLSKVLKQLDALDSLDLDIDIPDMVFQLSKGKVRLGPSGTIHVPGVDLDLGSLPKAHRNKVKRQLQQTQRRLERLEKRLRKLEKRRKTK